MRLPLLAALLTLAACSRPPRFVSYRSALGYTVQVPGGWTVDADPVSGRKPATTTFFRGPAELSIGRFVRARADIPDKEYTAYRDGFLKPTIKLFGDDAPTAATKSYARKSVVGTAIRTPKAYYLIECRSEPGNDAPCRAALDLAVSTFKAPVL